jgi:Amt family ammonium transporter
MTGVEHPADEAARNPRALFRAIVEHSSELVVVTDAIGTIHYASPSAANVLGYPADEYLGRNVVELLHPDEIDNAAASLASTARTDGVKEPLEIRLRRADGEFRWFEVIATNRLDDPDVLGIVFHGRDLTERLEQQRRFRMLFEQSPIASAMIRIEPGILANQAFADLVGYSREELRSVDAETIVVAEDRRTAIALTRSLVRGEIDSYTVEQRLIRKDGSTFWGRITTRLLYGRNGNIEASFTAFIDINAEREYLEALSDSERRFRAIVDNSSDIIAVLEPDGNWTASDAGTRQLGYPKGFDPDGGVFALVHPDDMGTAVEALSEVLDGRRGPLDAIELRIRDAAGEYHFYEAVGQNLGNDADVGGVVITARNVDRRRALEAQLAEDASHDALTGLLNRSAFMTRLERALARHARSRHPLGLLFLDLDRFKQVNDTLGHAAGDTLLCEISRRIEACVRTVDTVARLGGDEFVVLCEDIDDNDRALEIAERVVQAVEARVLIGEREAFVGASIGVAFAEPGQGASDLMRDADAAVYRAKREGRSRVERFDDAMRADTAARVTLEVDLRHALERGELEVEYEPVVDVQTRVVEAFVARPVWNRPDARSLRGSEIRVLADEAGLGRPLGQHLLSTSLRDLATWRGEQPAGAATRLYLSPTARHLVDRDFIEDLNGALESEIVVPGALCIGVPEEWLVDDTGVSAGAMARLREVGVRLAVNGFGRAHASLADLRKLPIDVVRLDPRFAFGLSVDKAGAAIVSAVIGLARALDLRVLADGVEELEHLVALFNLGCDFATGDILAPAVDAARATTLIDRSLEGASLTS